MNDIICSENRIKNDEKQNSNHDHEHDNKIVKELEVLKKLSGKILSNLNNYLSK